jgi:hypothetical protein
LSKKIEKFLEDADRLIKAAKGLEMKATCFCRGLPLTLTLLTRAALIRFTG